MPSRLPAARARTAAPPGVVGRMPAVVMSGVVRRVPGVVALSDLVGPVPGVVAPSGAGADPADCGLVRSVGAAAWPGRTRNARTAAATAVRIIEAISQASPRT